MAAKGAKDTFSVLKGGLVKGDELTVLMAGGKQREPYIIIARPKRSMRDIRSSVVMVVHAVSKNHALRLFAGFHGEMGTDYFKPKASPLITYHSYRI